MVKAAWATLITPRDPGYIAGLLIVKQCLQDVESQYPLVAMVTPDVAPEILALISRHGILITPVDYLLPGVDSANKVDVRFADAWTKLRAFGLYDYERVVLLDSDMIIMRNMDELMTLDVPSGWIAASHACTCNPRKLAHYPEDWIPANCAHTAVKTPTSPPPSITAESPRAYGLLNSGMVVLTPSADSLAGLSHYLATSPDVSTFLFADQDLIAAYFKGKWKPLNWYYNALKTLRVVHGSIWSDGEIRCLHYILSDKPWHARVGEPGTGGEFEVVNRWWWERFDKVEKGLRSSGDEEGLKIVLATVPPAL